MKIRNKRQFYDLYSKGFFGNRPMEWSSLEELKKSKYSGLVCIRGFNIPREYVRYNISQEELDKIMNEYKERKIKIERLKFNQSMPDKNLIIQGELTNGICGMHLTYTTIKKPMNLALKEEEIRVSGLFAVNLLKQSLFPSSYSDIQVLMERHPDSVIEFSSYSINVGDIKGRNTIIWEVRDY